MTGQMATPRSEATREKHDGLEAPRPTNMERFTGLDQGLRTVPCKRIGDDDPAQTSTAPCSGDTLTYTHYGYRVYAEA